MSSCAAVTDADHYTWLVVFGAFAAFFAAFGIGANDAANSFATSVGSKALTIKQACAMAVVCEFIGAVFFGSEVVKTVRKGIADEDAFEDNPALLMWGCVSVITIVGIWLVGASRFEIPVSTTHSCVGGMVGIAIALRGADAVVWFKDPSPPKKPMPGGFFGIVLSWVFSPVLSAIFGCIVFFLVRLVLRSKEPFKNTVRIYPVLVWFCVFVLTLFMLLKGLKSNKAIKELEIGTKVLVSLATGAAVAVLSMPVSNKLAQRIQSGKFELPALAIDEAPQVVSVSTTTGDESDKPTTTSQETGPTEKAQWAIFNSITANVHEAVGKDDATHAVHVNAERFDRQSESMFAYLQIVSACFDAIAHGANDVANAVGPFATIVALHGGASAGSSKQELGDDKWWILSIGGIGIATGLLMYGSRLIAALGVKLAAVTPPRGFSIEMGSSCVVLIGAYYGLPLSTTHCQFGATMGVAALEGAKGFNLNVVKRVLFGMLFTTVIVGTLAGLLASFGAYAPSARV